MKTMLARYPGTCTRTGARINPGDLIVFLGKGRAYLSDLIPAVNPKPVDPDLSLARSIDPELADSDPEAAAHAGRYLRQSIARGVSDIWRTSTGREYYRNRRGLCEDAPCCGCCNA
jgi:hypothetical protein